MNEAEQKQLISNLVQQIKIFREKIGNIQAMSSDQRAEHIKILKERSPDLVESLAEVGDIVDAALDLDITQEERQLMDAFLRDVSVMMKTPQGPLYVDRSAHIKFV